MPNLKDTVYKYFHQSLGVYPGTYGIDRIYSKAKTLFIKRKALVIETPNSSKNNLVVGYRVKNSRYIYKESDEKEDKYIMGTEDDYPYSLVTLVKDKEKDEVLKFLRLQGIKSNINFWTYEGSSFGPGCVFLNHRPMGKLEDYL